MQTPIRKTTKHRLSVRDEKILEHVYRYRMTTNEVLGKLFFAGMKPNTVTKVSARLTRQQILAAHPFLHPAKYFTLGDLGASSLGISEHRVLPLGPQSLPTEYGILAYATLGQEIHLRLTRQELIKEHGCPEDAPCSQPYCVHPKDGTLELIRVDLGGAPDHVVRKCRIDIHQRMSQPWLSYKIARHTFSLVIVTCTGEKAHAIQETLVSQLWPEGLRFHVAVVPNLLLLTASIHHATK